MQLGETFSFVKKQIIFLLESSGTWLIKRNSIRNVVSLITFTMFFLMLYFASPLITVVYVACCIILHFVFLFFIGIRTDIREKWVNKFGAEKTFQDFKTFCSASFFLYFTSILLVPQKVISVSLEEFIPYQALFIMGILMMLLGLIVRLWAINIVGMDTYYLKDFFFTPEKSDFTLRGPYKIFKHPMYGVGYLISYGFSLVYADLFTLILTACCQLAMMTFAKTIENPHIKRAYGTVYK